MRSEELECRIVAAGVLMTIWSVAGVDEQPDITLQRWRVYETERGEHHFVGYCVENASGRVSSAIVSFDAKSRAGITRSGRRYVLSGKPGFNQDALHVWSFWSLHNGVTETKDVSGEYWAQAKEGTSGTQRRRRR